MANKYFTAWDQVTLSPEADERIRTALAAAQNSKNNVVPLYTGNTSKKRVRNTARITLVAAVVVCLLSVTALAVSIGRIVFTEKDILVAQEGEEEPSEYVELDFDATTNDPIHMGVWTLDVPKRFEETEGSYYRDGDAGTYWKNGADQRIIFEYQAADLGYGQTLIAQADIREKQDVTVNGAPGHIYTYADNFGNLWTALYWVDEEKGVGFRLLCEDDSIDLLTLAETAHQTDDKPETNADTLDAIAEFGDWAPAALPGGYTEYISSGMPSKYGGEGNYGYVYRTYVNDAGYTIKLDYEVTYDWATYETYVDYYRDLPEDVGGYIVTDVTVRGLPAGLVENADGTPYMLAWISEDGSLAFKMYAEALTSDELIAVANSVALQ